MIHEVSKKIERGLTRAPGQDVIVFDVGHQHDYVADHPDEDGRCQADDRRQAAARRWLWIIRSATHANQKIRSGRGELLHRGNDRDQAFGVVNQQEPSLGRRAEAGEIERDRGDGGSSIELRAPFLPGSQRPIGGVNHQQQGGDLDRGEPAAPAACRVARSGAMRQECERRRDQCPDLVSSNLAVEREHPGRDKEGGGEAQWDIRALLRPIGC